tara:strand:+ start:411 stop:1334 length:924 start_codon:yes stop_codon:yes gene_type:complete
MKIAIFGNERRLKKQYFTKRIDAYFRNTLIISDYLDATFLYNENEYNKHLETKFDAILIFYANYYSPVKQMKQIAENNKYAKYYFIANEYTITPAYTFLQDKDVTLISNWEEEGKIMLNLNLLFSKTPNEVKEKPYDCVYYGTFRTDRAEYCKEYFKEDLYLSTTSKNFKKYKHIGCKAKLIKKLSWEENKETLNMFKYQLYIEDKHTHKVFNNLANRYYEAGFCNNVVFFDVNCRNTINKSELGIYKEQVADYIVENYEDLQNKIKECNKDFSKHLAIQKSWRMNEQLSRKLMLEELKNIIYNGTK